MREHLVSRIDDLAVFETRPVDPASQLALHRADHPFEFLGAGLDELDIGGALYFCKMMIELWGGDIGFQSRPGGGACFWFRLPALAGPDME